MAVRRVLRQDHIRGLLDPEAGLLVVMGVVASNIKMMQRIRIVPRVNLYPVAATVHHLVVEHPDTRRLFAYPDPVNVLIERRLPVSIVVNVVAEQHNVRNRVGAVASNSDSAGRDVARYFTVSHDHMMARPVDHQLEQAEFLDDRVRRADATGIVVDGEVARDARRSGSTNENRRRRSAVPLQEPESGVWPATNLNDTARRQGPWDRESWYARVAVWIIGVRGLRMGIIDIVPTGNCAIPRIGRRRRLF